MENLIAHPLPAFFSSDHALHAPPVEFIHGKLVPYHEMPQRIENIRQHLESTGLIQVNQPSQKVTEADLLRTHDASMVAYLQTMSQGAAAAVRHDYAGYNMEAFATDDDYFYASVFPLASMSGVVSQHMQGRKYFAFDGAAPLGKGTWQAVHSSASAAWSGTQAILNGQTRSAYAMCRPPGHHAGPNFIGGYCYLNNAAIAAKAFLSLGNVAIIDIDYHHGNGTQAIFWDEPRVLFASIHADPAQEYPAYAGYAGETGGPGAQGTTLNLPLPPGTAEAGYLAAFDVLLARVQAFSPAALVVSLGFDTYKDDPIGTFKLDDGSYHKLGSLISALNLPVLYVQEGGYCVDALGRLAEAFFRGVLDC